MWVVRAGRAIFCTQDSAENGILETWFIRPAAFGFARVARVSMQEVAARQACLTALILSGGFVNKVLPRPVAILLHQLWNGLHLLLVACLAFCHFSQRRLAQLKDLCELSKRQEGNSITWLHKTTTTHAQTTKHVLLALQVSDTPQGEPLSAKLFCPPPKGDSQGTIEMVAMGCMVARCCVWKIWVLLWILKHPTKQ